MFDRHILLGKRRAIRKFYTVEMKLDKCMVHNIDQGSHLISIPDSTVVATYGEEMLMAISKELQAQL